MAEQRKPNRRRPASDRQRPRSRGPRRDTRQKKPGLIEKFLRSRKQEFRPDTEEFNLLNIFHLTQVQRDRLAKWGGYTGVLLLLLMIQDVIMSRTHIFGTTTDLVVCCILLITVIEGVETGSIFVLIASSLYYFSGSSPGPFSIAMLCILGIFACVFRQTWLHRSHGSIVLCAGAALMAYEIAVYLMGIFQGLTRWDRLNAFLITGAMSFAVMIPLYKLIDKIGQIGGNPWKE